MSEKFDYDNYLFRSDLNAKNTFVCKVIDCYFTNEYFENYIDEKLNDDEQKYLMKYIKNCPLCAYDYENVSNMRKKIRYEMTKNAKPAKSILRAKFLEITITVFAGLLLVCSLFYFFIKFNTFLKSEESDNREVSEINQYKN